MPPDKAIVVRPWSWENLAPRFDERSILSWATLLVVLWLVLAPVAMVALTSFQAEPLAHVAVYTIGNYLEVYLDPDTYELLSNTLLFGAGAIAVGFFFAFPLAWLVERTNTPGRNMMYGLILIPMAIPPMISALGWERLLDPKIGLINIVLRGLLGIEGDDGPLNIFTLFGMSFVMGLSMVPTVFLILAPSIRNLDPSYEDASLVSGATWYMTFRRVTLPLVYPAFFAALIWFFIIAIEAFEIPGVIGLQAGILVFSTKIFWAVHPPTGDLPDYGIASALAAFVLVLSAILVYFYLKVLGTGEKYTTITGRGYRPSIVDLGTWRYAGTLFFAGYMILAIVLPIIVLAWGSLLAYYQPPAWDLVEQLSLENYYTTFEDEDFLGVFWNTGVVVFTAATVTAVICTVAAWIVVRFPGRLSSVLNLATFTPIAVPSVIIGLALILVYLSIPIGLYGTIWIIAIAHITRYLSYGSRTMIASQVQIHKELEEASYTCGASFRMTLRKVIMPILLPALVSLWLWVALHSIRELSAAVLLASSNNTVISTLIWTQYHEGEVGVAYALSVILIAVSFVIAFAGRRLLSWHDHLR
jgi:iron(III) transport system permease protein